MNPNQIRLVNLLGKIGNRLDRTGFNDEAEVIDSVLKRLAVKELHRCKKQVEARLVNSWVTYNQIAAQVRRLDSRITCLRNDDEGASNDILGS